MLATVRPSCFILFYVCGRLKARIRASVCSCRYHITDQNRLHEYRKPTYVQPKRLIKRRSFSVTPSQNPLIKEKIAHQIAVGSRAARTGKLVDPFQILWGSSLSKLFASRISHSFFFPLFRPPEIQLGVLRSTVSFPHCGQQRSSCQLCSGIKIGNLKTNIFFGNFKIFL